MLTDRWILDVDGRTPIPEPDLYRWADWIEKRHSNPELGRVGWDWCNDRRITVSTTFLGLDHSFGEGPPLLFETMIFGGRYDSYMERYSTWEEAERGHLEACERAGINRLLRGPE